MSTRERADLSTTDRIRAKLSDYLTLTKPRIIHVVIGAVPAMLLAERGTVAPLLILNTLIGATLRESAAQLRRTKQAPPNNDRIHPGHHLRMAFCSEDARTSRHAEVSSK